jgi:peptide/nickel transport system permease protein
VIIFCRPVPWTKLLGGVHYLGTDHLGRDYFTRMLYAARTSLTVAFTSVTIAVLLGVLVGAVAGYYQGMVDGILMRVVDFLLTLPDIPILLIVSSMLLQNENAIPLPKLLLDLMGKVMLLTPNEARNAVIIILVLAGLGWMGVARLMRGQVLSLRNQPFIEAAHALGASDAYIIFRHLIPNAMAPIIVTASLALGGTLIAEAILSFLGFGIQDPIPTWGNMLYATRAYMTLRLWLPIMVGSPIFICSLAINFIGDGLRDALDPRLKR